VRRDVQAENKKENHNIRRRLFFGFSRACPYTNGLNAEAGVKNLIKEVEVNDHLQTSISNIYAIGDVVRGDVSA
jgi:dihydrolipoamide dehydrogenase